MNTMAFIFWFSVLGILYTYGGYPALLFLLTRFRKKIQNYAHSEPPVTLLIAAYNEEASIRQKLENCLKLDYPTERLQILVAADGSNDKTVEIVQSFRAHGVILSYRPERRGKMAAINRAMEMAQGEIIIFSDANNLYDIGTLRALVAPFIDPSVGAVSGAKIIAQGDGGLGESEGAYWKYESWIKKQETILGCTTGVSGEIWAIRKKLFATPPDTIINDDFFMAMRIVKQGYRMVYAPQARSTERVSLTAQDEIIRRTRIVAGRYQAIMRAKELVPLNSPLVAWEIISHKFLRPLVPFGMIFALIANFWAVFWPHQTTGSILGNFFALASPWNLLFLGIQLAFYLLALVGNLLPGINKKIPALYLPTFLVNSNLAALLGLIRFTFGGQSTLWIKARRRD